MELVHGEAIGRRDVKAPPPGLDLQMAEQLAKIHSIPGAQLPFLPGPDLWQRLYATLDSVDEPHPAIELGIAWCRERLPLERPRVVSHGDFRIGNLSELQEIRGDRLSSIPAGELEDAFVHAFRGVVPNERRFLGGETIGELFDRVIPALGRLLADGTWDTALLVLHGAVNRAVLSYALTGERMFLGHFEQAPGCVNVLDVGDEWIVCAVNVAPTDLLQTGRG